MKEKGDNLGLFWRRAVVKRELGDGFQIQEVRRRLRNRAGVQCNTVTLSVSITTPPKIICV